MSWFIRAAVEEVEVICALHEGDVGLVYDRSPLERGTYTCQSLYHTKAAFKIMEYLV